MTFTSDGRRQWIFGIALHGDHYARKRQQSWSVEPDHRVAPELTRFAAGRSQAGAAPHHGPVCRYVRRPGGRADPGPTLPVRRAAGDPVVGQCAAQLDFHARVSLEVYAQPLLSSGEYLDYKELSRPRSYEFLPTGTPTVAPDDSDRLVVAPATPGVPQLEFDNPNFSLASLRGNAVLRWEYRPGSTIFFVWTQNRSDTVTDGKFRIGDGFDRLIGAPGNNVFLVKFSYWWRP